MNGTVGVLGFTELSVWVGSTSLQKVGVDWRYTASVSQSGGSILQGCWMLRAGTVGVLGFYTKHLWAICCCTSLWACGGNYRHFM